MSLTTVMHHLKGEDRIRATVKADPYGSPYAVLDLGSDVTMFANAADLRRVHAVIDEALARMNDPRSVTA